MFRFLLEKNNKAISPVVATSLLLVVAVSSVVFFQGWFNDFSSSVLVDIESDSSSSNSAVRVEGIVGDNLYLNSVQGGNMDLFVVKDDTGNEICSVDIGSKNNSQNLTNGLLGHWTFDDFGPIINDKSGNDVDGILYGDSRVLLNFDENSVPTDLTAYNYSFNQTGNFSWNNAGCVNGGCYFLNNSLFQTIDNNLTFEADTLTQNWISISFWMKFEIGENTTRVPVAKYSGGVSGGDMGWLFVIDPDDGVGFDGRNLQNKYHASPRKSISDNNWHHYVGVYDRGNFSLYVDGEFIETTVTNNTLIEFNTSLVIGNRGINNPYPFTGFIDELGVYTKVLSNSEVLNLYNSKKTLFIEFKENGVEFDDYYSFVNVSNNIDFSKNYTKFAVAKVYSDVHADNFISSGNGGHAFWKSSNNRFSIANTNMVGGWPRLNYYYPNSNDLINNKVYYAGTYDGDEFQLYLNGKLVNSSSGNAPPEVPISEFYFGRHSAKGLSSMDGIIYETRIYDRVLSDEEINLLSFGDLSFESGLNKIDLSSCNLEKGKKYDILTGSKDGLSEVSVIVK